MVQLPYDPKLGFPISAHEGAVRAEKSQSPIECPAATGGTNCVAVQRPAPAAVASLGPPPALHWTKSTICVASVSAVNPGALFGTWSATAPRGRMASP